MLGECEAGRVAAPVRSVQLLRVRPAGEAGDRVERTEQPSHQLIRIFLRAQLLETTEDARQRLVGTGDRTLREVLTLPRETFAVPDELLTIEVGRKTDRGAQNPIRADDACHATPRVVTWTDKNSVTGRCRPANLNSMPRPRGRPPVRVGRRPLTRRATISPPMQPRSIP